jgi:hypothetical protein
VNEAQFIRALIKVAKDNNLDYNIVEAFNQPWKSQLEGVVGANWGLYSVDRKEVFPLTGKVYENPEWRKGLLASIAIFLLVTLRFWQSLKNLSSKRLLIFLVFLQLLSVLLVSQMHTLWYTSYNDFQRLRTLLIVASNIFLGGLILRRSYSLLVNEAFSPKLSAFLYKLYLLFSVFAGYQTFQIALDGRYLSFSTVEFYIPIAGLIGLIAIRYLSESQCKLRTMSIFSLLGDNGLKPKQNQIIGGLLLFLGMALIVGETYAFMLGHDLIVEQPEFWTRLRVCLTFALTNCQLLTWLASLTVLAVPFLMDRTEQLDA